MAPGGYSLTIRDNDENFIVTDMGSNFLDTGPGGESFDTSSTINQLLNDHYSQSGVTQVSLSKGGTPLSGNEVYEDLIGQYFGLTLYDVSPDPDPETITGFYLDGTKYKFEGGGAASGVTTEQPSNPVAGSTYYDTTNNVIKVYNGTAWEEVGGGNVIAMTQSEYDALPAATKNDGKLRIITDAPTLDIVDDTAFGASWDGDTDTAPSKNAVYDAIGNIETLLAAI